VRAPRPGAATRTDRLAITSVVLGGVATVGIPLLGPILTIPVGIAAIVTGAVELRKIAAGGGSPTSRDLALAGLICSLLALGIAVVLLYLGVFFTLSLSYALSGL
jgi:hypothetical protein